MIVTALVAALLVQTPAPQQLGKPDARSSEGYTNIFAVHELADGRVLMSDNLDRALRIIDFKAKTSKQLGRNGSGPKEYVNSHTIIAGRGDTVLIADNNQRRFVKVVNGEIVGTQPQPDMLRSLSTFSAPLSDSRGLIYFDVRDIRASATGGITENNGSVMRYTPATNKLDTIAVIRVERHAPRVNNGYNPFTYRSAWGLAADGRIAVVETDPYRVTWITNGKATTVGTPIPYERVKIDDDERDAERDRFSNSRNGSAQMIGPRTETRGSRDPRVRSRLPDDVFPPYKPPFIEDRVLVSPTGDVWIPRAMKWNSATSIIDVVGADGKLKRQITIPSTMRVVGFGKAHIYVATKDEDDVQWLERIAN